MKKKLNLTVVMRSHDCWGGYPLNLAACCRWLCEEAERLGMAVGTLTCVSMSAHVYARDWDLAREKAGLSRRIWNIPPSTKFDLSVKFGSAPSGETEPTTKLRTVVLGRHDGPVEVVPSPTEQEPEPTRLRTYPKAPAWQQDPRSAWRVWREAVVKPHTMALLPRTVDEDTGDPDTPLAGCTVCRRYRIGIGPTTDVEEIQAHTNKVFAKAQAAGHEAYDGHAFCEGVEYVYHAEATDPEGTRVLVKLSAPTRERLVRDVQACGLVTDVRHALWLGAEIGRL